MEGVSGGGLKLDRHRLADAEPVSGLVGDAGRLGNDLIGSTHLILRRHGQSVLDMLARSRGLRPPCRCRIPPRAAAHQPMV